eukprot:1478427-Rhodomonas_salina.1
MKVVIKALRANQHAFKLLTGVLDNGHRDRLAEESSRSEEKSKVSQEALDAENALIHDLEASFGSAKTPAKTVLAEIAQQETVGLILQLMMRGKSQFMNGETQLKIVRIALKIDGLALQYVSDMIPADKQREVVSLALKQNGAAIQFAGDDLTRDRDIALIAVEQTGRALQYLNDELRKDRGVVKAAVCQDGTALEFADPSFHEDLDIVKRAVDENGEALQWVTSQRLIMLPQFQDSIKTAVGKNGRLLQYASETALHDKLIVQAAAENDIRATLYGQVLLDNHSALIQTGLRAAAKMDGSGGLKFESPSWADVSALEDSSNRTITFHSETLPAVAVCPRLTAVRGTLLYYEVEILEQPDLDDEDALQI